MKNELIKLDINPAEYKILIVDDMISDVLLLKTLLKTENYQIIAANDGIQALKKVADEHPDLILLDIIIPGFSGFEVSKQLRSSPEYHDIPIIFLTALNNHEDIVEDLELVANDFITKPFNKDELKIRVKHQISLIAAKRIILKQTEELRAIIIGRDKLYSVIAHDLRGPLGSIKMILNLMQSSIDKQIIGDDMFDMLRMANMTTEEIFALLDNLLKWTKSQLGLLNVASQNIDIADLVQDGIDISLTSAELKQIRIEFNPKESCMVTMDTDMIKTVLRNLISNAIKFSHKGSSIIINIDKSDDRLATVSIKDHGCGIKEEDKNKLLATETHFSTFGTNNEEGAGLGLLLCVDFIHKNGGTLWFDSAEGKGSTFYFTIPKISNKPAWSQKEKAYLRTVL